MVNTMKSMLFLILLLLIPATTFADGAFKWTDAEGNTHYGNNPPKDATNQSTVSDSGFSKYSGSKVIKRYEHFIKQPAAATTESIDNNIDNNDANETEKIDSSSGSIAPEDSFAVTPPQKGEQEKPEE